MLSLNNSKIARFCLLSRVRGLHRKNKVTFVDTYELQITRMVSSFTSPNATFTMCIEWRVQCVRFIIELTFISRSKKGNNTGNLPQLLCSVERRVELICQRELLDLETPAGCSYSQVPVNVMLNLSTPHKTTS